MPAPRLAQPVFDEMQALAEASSGERIMFLTGLGSTETAPMAIARMWQSADSTNMGVPVPGVELKLVPSDGKLEARVKGPNIMPGYWRQPELTAKVFDEEGYYCLGDAVRFEDPADPKKGLLFDGRIAEDFKLATGTWVSVGPLRAQFLAHFAPYAKDVVIAGADLDDIRVLVFPDLEACRTLAPDQLAKASAADIVNHPQVRARFQQLLDSLAKSEHRQLQPRRRDGADRRPALAGRRRDHRQGLHQPARRAAVPRTARRRPLRAAGPPHVIAASSQ